MYLNWNHYFGVRSNQGGRKESIKPNWWNAFDPWQVDIQELFEASVNEPDEIKKNLYDSLYTYILQKRQEDIINRPGFVI